MSDMKIAVAGDRSGKPLVDLLDTKYRNWPTRCGLGGWPQAPAHVAH